MIREIGAKRYAEALFQIGRESGKLEEWGGSLEVIATLLREPEVAAAMRNAKLPLPRRLGLVERALDGMDAPLVNLAKLLVARGRAPWAPQIAAVFRELVDEHQGVARARVTTAVPLSQEEQGLVAQKLAEISGRKIVLEVEVDESIIGGLVACVGDLLIDGSTRGKLLALKRQLEGARA